MKFFLAFCLLLVCADCSWACPACARLAMTFGDELDVSSAVVLAQSVPGTTNRFTVVRALRGTVNPGRVLLTASQAATGSVLLTTNGSPGAPFWNGKAVGADDDVLLFARGALELPKRYAQGARDTRLPFFLPYLGHPNRVLADAAASEFMEAPYAVVAHYAPMVGGKKLRALIAARDTSDDHRSLYFVMLAALGNPKDLDLVEPRLDQAVKGPVPVSLGATLVCYLQLKGEPGLPRVVHDFLEAGGVREDGAMLALRMHGNEKSPIHRQKIEKIFRSMLPDKVMAGPIIQDLALWADWESLPAVAKLLDLPKDDRCRYIRISVVRYLRTCPLAAAKKLLKHVEASEPQLAEMARFPFMKDPLTQ